MSENDYSLTIVGSSRGDSGLSEESYRNLSLSVEVVTFPTFLVWASMPSVLGSSKEVAV